jgi:hypothetical protein
MRRVLIVGNSCSLLEKENGNKIDNYDYVVRMGDFPRITGYEKYVGTKTDMFRIKWFNFFKVEHGIYDDDFGDARTVCDFTFKDILCISHDPDCFHEIAHPFQRYADVSLNRSFYFPIGDRYLHDGAKQFFNLDDKQWYFFNSTDMQGLVMALYKCIVKNTIKYTNGIEPSGGLCTLWYFLTNFSNDNITITGFDGWRTNHYWKRDVNTFFASHNGMYENLFIKILLKKGIINVL